MTELWTDSELKKVVIAYFDMLNYQKNNTPYVKIEINRNLQKDLPGRTPKSIEYRWQNISSVLNDNKLEYVKGFKPLNHVGAAVKERIWKIIKDLDLLP